MGTLWIQYLIIYSVVSIISGVIAFSCCFLFPTKYKVAEAQITIQNYQRPGKDQPLPRET